MMQIYSDERDKLNYSRVFYQYLGIHSLLIGIFPFFAPVFLWDRQYGLAEISFFISLSGLGFCFALFCWDRLIRQITLFRLMVVSLVLELCVLLSVSISPATVMLIGFSLLYGVYNCFFWTTQRALFYETLSDNNSGRKYGNFQIFVAVVLQIGIFIGGLLLEKSGLMLIYLLSCVTCLLAAGYFFRVRYRLQLPARLLEKNVLSMRQLISYRDHHRTRLIFVLDGLYLFLESFFWLISLFLLAHESFWQLGVMVILLSVVFFIIFVIIKNTIDHIASHIMYKIAVCLYALSWALRAMVTGDLSLHWLFVMLVVITFCTSYFRLAFNKRFYDLAQITTAHHYLIKKSYYSQASLALVYLLIGLALLISSDVFHQLQQLYWLAAPLALLYLGYGRQLNRDGPHQAMAE